MNNKFFKWIYYIILALIVSFGFYIRTKLYILGNVFEDDECRLALGMMDKSLWQIFLPIGSFSSTPLFLFFSKIIAEVSHYNEYALKMIPYIFSIASIGLFYKISTTYLNRKILILLALILFVVNKPCIYFSSIFKTYSIEVFSSLLCLYFLPKINILGLNKKQTIFFIISVILLILTSLPSLFFVGIFFLINLYRNYNNKLFYKKLFAVLLPLLVVFGIYYFFNLLPAKELQLQDYSSFWNDIFSAGFMATIVTLLRYLFEPNSYVLSICIFIIVYTILVLVNRKFRTETDLYIMGTFYLSIFASYFHFYPIVIGRTGLFLVPVIIFMVIKTLDAFKLKNKGLYLMSFLFIIGFYVYFTPSYIKEINNVMPTFRNFAPSSLMQDMIKRFNPSKDDIVTTEASMFSYTFYAIQNKFYYSWNMMEHKGSIGNNSREMYYDYYNKLDKNKNYWFYLIKEYPQAVQMQPTLEWLEHQNILYSKKELGSYLYYISGINEVSP